MINVIGYFSLVVATGLFIIPWIIEKTDVEGREMTKLSALFFLIAAICFK